MLRCCELCGRLNPFQYDPLIQCPVVRVTHIACGWLSSVMAHAIVRVLLLVHLFHRMNTGGGIPSGLAPDGAAVNVQAHVFVVHTCLRMGLQNPVMRLVDASGCFGRSF